MNILNKIRKLIFLTIAVSCAYGQMTISGKVGLSGSLTCQTPAPVYPIFSPAPGTYTTPQSVTMTCPSGQNGFYRTDGGLVTIASPIYSSPITVSSSETIVGICATLGGTPTNPTYHTNTQASNTGAVCHVGPNQSGSITFPSGVTCTYSGGVGTITPTNVVWSIPGGSLPSTDTITTPATSSSDVEGLFTLLYGGSAAPSYSTCDSCTEQVKDVKFTVIGAGLDNQEFDMPQYDNTHGVNRQNGTQCQGSSGKIQVDSGNAGGTWTTTTAPCSNWTNGTTHEEVNRVDHIISDTGCGGNGCANYKYIWIDGTNYTLNGNYSGTQGYNSQSGATAWGWQFQPDMKKTTGTAATGGWSVISATVALGFGDETPPVSGTYTINTAAPAFSATPTTIAEGSILTNTTAYFQLATVTNTGTANLTFSSIGFTGTNAADFSVTHGFSPSVNMVGGNTLPQCSTSTALAPSASCIVPVDFVPGGSGSRTASLQFVDNAPGSPHTVALTGTGTAASGTAMPACGSMLSANTTYHATGNVTCNDAGWGINGSNITVNLNGFAVTCGQSPSTTGVGRPCFYSGQSFANPFNLSTCAQSGASHNCYSGVTPTTSNSGNVTIENGTINVAGGATSAATMQYTSTAIFTGENADVSGGWSIHDLTINIPVNCTSCWAYNSWPGDYGNGPGDKFYKVTVNDNSGFVHSRCSYEGLIAGFSFQSGSGNPGAVAYENTFNHTPQIGFSAATNYSIIFGNTIEVGNPNGTDAGTASTCSGVGTGTDGTESASDFAVEITGSNVGIYNNTISNYEGRGFDISAPNGGVSNDTTSGNSITTTDIPNYVEYQSAGGCQLGGSYGERMKMFGFSNSTNNSFQNDTITVNANQCEGAGIAQSGNSSTGFIVQDRYSGAREASQRKDKRFGIAAVGQDCEHETVTRAAIVDMRLAHAVRFSLKLPSWGWAKCALWIRVD